MSLLEDEPETARILAGAASGAVLGWHAFTVVTKKKRFWKKAGLSLMAAGSISNMFDRLVRGHVVDFAWKINIWKGSHIISRISLSQQELSLQ